MKFFNGLMKMSWKLTLKGSSSAYNREKNIFIGGEGIQKENLLGLIINNVNKSCDTASQKINVLARLSSFSSLDKRQLIMKAFMNLQF